MSPFAQGLVAFLEIEAVQLIEGGHASTAQQANEMALLTAFANLLNPSPAVQAAAAKARTAVPVPATTTASVAAVPDEGHPPATDTSSGFGG